MKSNLTFILFFILLALSPHIRAEQSATNSQQIYLNNSFTIASDTVGWLVTGNDANLSNNRNWHYSSTSQAMLCGNGSNLDQSSVYTLTSPDITLGVTGGDLSFSYEKTSANSRTSVYILKDSIRIPLSSNIPVSGYNWEQLEISLSQYAGETFQIVFEHTNISGYFGLDNIKVEEPPICPKAKHLKLSNVSLTSVDISWDNSISDSYILMLCSSSQLDPNATLSSEIVRLDTVNVISGPWGYSTTLSSLIEGSEYYLYIRSNCDATGHGYSVWSDELKFQTPCSSQSVPYSENFDNDIEGSTPSCWITSSSNDLAPMVIDPITGDKDTTKVFRISSNVNSECIIVFPLLNVNIEDLMINFKAKSAHNNTTFSVGLTNDLSDIQSSITLFNQTLSTEWENYTFFLNNSYITGQNYYIVFFFPSGMTDNTNNFYIYFDDIMIETAPSCLFPIQVKVDSIQDNNCKISWTDKNVAPIQDYTIEYTTLVGNQSGSTNTVQTTQTSYILSGLTPDTDYSIRVRTNCSLTDQSQYSTAYSIHTLKPSIIVSKTTAGIEDFEQEATTFILDNGSAENQWAIGTATAYSPTHALYLSSDGGFSVGSSTGYESTVYAYANVKIPEAGTYRICFDWKGKSYKAYGSNTNIYMASPEKEIVTGKSWMTPELNTIQVGDWRLDNTPNQQWEKRRCYIDIPSAGMYRLVLIRKTSAYAPSGDYTAFDDFSITYVYCPIPSTLEQTSVGTSSVGIKWVGTSSNYNVKAFTKEISIDSIALTDVVPAVTQSFSNDSVILTGLSEATKYYIYLQGDCGTHQSDWIGPLEVVTNCSEKDLPYTENFDLLPDLELPLCWAGTDGDIFVQAIPSEVFNINNTPGLHLVGSYEVLDYAIMPSFSSALNKCVLEFDYISENRWYKNDIVVGYVTNALDYSTFVSLDTFPSSFGEVQHVLVNYNGVPDSVEGRIAIEIMKSTAWKTPMGANVDNVLVYEAPSCWPIENFNEVTDLSENSFSLSWQANALSADNFIVEYGLHGFTPGHGQVVQVDTNTCTLVGLIPGTEYDVYVSTDCGDADGVSSSSMTTVKTLISPAEAANYYCNFEDSIENKNWTFSAQEDANTWAIGNLAHYEGENGMYIVRKDGILGYTKPQARTWAYRFLHCAPGLYSVSFDYQCEGQRRYDFMQNFIAPNQFIPSAIEETITYMGMTPEGWETGYPSALYEKTGWQHYSYEFIVNEETIKTLAFYWENNGTEHNMPAMVDNICVKKVSCRPAFGITVDSLTQTSVSLYWESETFDHFEVVIDPIYHNTEFLDTTTQASYINRNVTNRSLQVNNLLPGTKYYVYVHNICNDSTSANWSSSLVFSTLCNTFTIPYSDTFEENNTWSSPNCWTLINGKKASVYSDVAFNSKKALYLKAEEASNMLIALPFIQFDQPIENYQLVFYVYRKATDATNDIQISILQSESATVADLNKLKDEPIIISKGDETHWKRIVVPFTHPIDFITGDSIIMDDEQAIMLQINGPAELYLDEVSVMAKPTCSEPFDVSLDSILATSLYYSWSGISNSYEVECINLIDQDTITSICSEDSLILNGLQAHTSYKIHVRSVCSPDDKSYWSQFLTFTTDCTPEILPYVEDFNDKTEIPVCWSTTANYDDKSWNVIQEGPQTFLRMGSDATSYHTYNLTLTSPELDLSSATNVLFSFDAKASNTSDITTRVVLIDLNTNSTEDIFTTLLTTSDWQNYSFDAKAYIGHKIQIRFITEVSSRTSGYLSIDNFKVEDKLFVSPPIGFSINNITSNSATLNFLSDTSVTSYDIVVVPENVSCDPNTALSIRINDTTSYLLSMLQPGCYYKLYARSNHNESSSNWIGPRLFSTICGMNALPYQESFETLHDGIISMPLCWNKTGDVRIKEAHQTSGMACLKISKNAMAILPEIAEELNTAELFFNAFSYGVTSVVVRACANSTTTSASVVVDTITITGDVGILLNVPLTSLPSGCHTILLENIGGAVFIDNLVVDTYNSCRIPNDFNISNIEPGRAQVIISDSTASDSTYYDIAYGLGDTMQVISSLTPSLERVGDSTWLSSLPSGLCYTVFVRKHEGHSLSQWIGPRSFFSSCVPIDINNETPYSETLSEFLTTSYTLPICWQATHSTYSSAVPYAYINEGVLKVKSGLNDTLYITMPEIENNLHTLTFKMDVKLSSSSYSSEDTFVYIGTMEDPNNTTSFNPIKQLDLKGLSTSSFITIQSKLSYSSIPSSHHFLALRVMGDDHEFYFKNFEVNILEQAGAPILSLNSTRSTQAVVNIDRIVTTTGLDLILMDESGNDVLVINDSLPTSSLLTFKNLTPGTEYSLCARSLFTSDTGNSTTAWSDTLWFNLPLDAVTSYPYYCNFENDLENSQWLLPHRGLINRWMIGREASTSESNKGLFVTQDNHSAGFDVTQNTFTWASRRLHLVPGSYNISFMIRSGSSDYQDYTRAFLVEDNIPLLPCNYETSNDDVFNYTSIGYLDVPEGFIDILGTKHYLYAAGWTKFSKELVVLDTVDYQLAFLWRSDDEEGSQPGACVDSVMVEYQSNPAPLNLEISCIKSNYIKAKAQDKLLENNALLRYVVVLRDSSVLPEQIIADTLDTTSHEVILKGLSPLTDYDLYVARLDNQIENVQGKWSEPLAFTTPRTPASIPYVCDFEPSNEETNYWTLINDNANQWIVDSSDQITGKYSLYITNNFKTVGYDNSTDQDSYAVRTIHFEKGSYNFSYKWKCVGDNFADYMYIFLTPDSFMPEAGNSTINGTSISYNMNTPEGSLMFGYLNRQSTEQDDEVHFDITEDCNLNLIIAWHNDDNSKGEVPALIDSLSITKVQCMVPINPYTNEISAHSATLAWTNYAPRTHLAINEIGETSLLFDTIVSDTFFVASGLRTNTTYQYRLYSICEATDISAHTRLQEFTTPCSDYVLPLNENFDESIEIPTCWFSWQGQANLDSITSNAVLHETTSGWYHSTAVATHEAIINQGNGEAYWFVTPFITLSHDARLQFKLAVTEMNTWNRPTFVENQNDKFAVMISRDHGQSWSVLKKWSSDTITGLSFANLNPNFTQYTLPIAKDTSSLPIQLAFYTESNNILARNQIHLDEIHLNCLMEDTIVFDDEICAGYAYSRNGFTIPANQVATRTYTQTIMGSEGVCDQIQQLKLKVNPTYNIQSTATICQGQSYPFANLNLTTEGSYVESFSSINGCDSIVNLNLIVTKLEVNKDTFLCEGNSLDFADQTISNSGIYSDTVRNAEGCDSITNLNVWIIPTHCNIDTTICEGELFQIDETPYSTSGYYVDTLQNVLGCDSIVTLDLNVIPYDSVYSDQFCQGGIYNFRGKILSASGEYRDTLHNYLGSNCDHVYVLQLIETSPDTTKISDQFCQGATSYSNFGFEINNPEEKEYSKTLTSYVTGCDSLVFLQLLEIKTVYDTIYQTICDNESYSFGKHDYYVEGTYSETFTTQSTNCDSVVTLFLKVNPTYEVNILDSITTDQLPYVNLTLEVPKDTKPGTYDYRISTQSTMGCDSIINLTLKVKTPDGLNDIKIKTLTFYPNVVKGGELVTITTNFAASQHQGMSIQLFDATGKLVSTYKPTRIGTLKLSMPTIPGLYYLNIKLENGNIYGGKIIVL